MLMNRPNSNILKKHLNKVAERRSNKQNIV